MATLIQPVSSTQYQPFRRIFRGLDVPGMQLMLWVTASVVLIDCVTKIIAQLTLGRLPNHASDVIPGVLRFWLNDNGSDVMGGVLQLASQAHGQVAFAAAGHEGLPSTAIGAIVALLAFAYYRWLPASNRFLMVCVGLQVGGGLANLLDWLGNGHITDFIGVGLGALTWPWFVVFNLADVGVELGVIMMAAYLLVHPDALLTKRRRRMVTGRS